MGSNPIFRSDRLGTQLVLIIGGGPPGGRTNVCGGSIPSPSAFMSLVEAAPKVYRVVDGSPFPLFTELPRRGLLGNSWDIWA
jgi:hypothetical protein